jgi:hypothetical protein
LDNILNVQWNIFNTAAEIDPSTSGDEPIRVVHDGQFITSTLTGKSFPRTLKPIVLTNVNMEAGPAIFSSIGPLPSAAWNQVLSQSFTSDEVHEIDDSGFYHIPTNSDDIRPELVNLGTDQIWRCPTWTLARAWAELGGQTYVGVFDVGNVYPDIADISFCTSTNVCHEGDIEVVVSLVALILGRPESTSPLTVWYNTFSVFCSKRCDLRDTSTIQVIPSKF